MLNRCTQCKHYSSDEELNKADFRTCIECTKKILKESGKNERDIDWSDTE